MNGHSVRIAGSFRDPSGYLFFREGELYRQVNDIYKSNYDRLMDSGLYSVLVKAGLLIPHQEVQIDSFEPSITYKTIKPETISFISYPYEWSFSQLKDAALVTLEVQKVALKFGMSLKDASAYNIQFRKGKPVFIDTLSFENYQEGKPWIAYKQFCQHFLSPLALSRYKDIRLSQLLRIYMDGIPLDLTSLLLPIRTRFVFPLLMHIHLHAKSQKYFAGKSSGTAKGSVSRMAFLGIIDSLDSGVRALKLLPSSTEWSGYYDNTNYSPSSFEHKKIVVSGFLDEVTPNTVWDFGANTGVFSRIASEKGIRVIAFDIDHGAAMKNYSECAARGEENILPLLFDINNPSPGIGWGNSERMTIFERGPTDTAMALALIHHLAISNNMPFGMIAKFFSRICGSLIIEFVPKNDSQVIRLLANRNDIFPDYDQFIFEREFGEHFTIRSSVKIEDSQRILYLMERVKQKT
jgi:ribosomal protein L11 methylase PrmA